MKSTTHPQRDENSSIKGKKKSLRGREKNRLKKKNDKKTPAIVNDAGSFVPKLVLFVGARKSKSQATLTARHHHI